MIVEYIRYDFAKYPEAERDARCHDLVAAYRQAAGALDGSADCTGYELSQCLEHPHRYVLRIVWRSLDAHVKGFRGSPAFRPFLTAIRSFIPDIAEMTHYAPTEIARDKASPGGAAASGLAPD